MWDEIARLHDYHGDVPAEISVLKVQEEAGEAAQALIWSPRKGAHTTTGDVLDELADVMITAAVAMARISGNADAARSNFERRLATVTARAGLASPAGERHWTASAIVLHPCEDKVLLVDHVKSGYWLFPGGHVEPRESLAEAAVREVREETGIDAEIITGPVPAYDPVVTHPVPFAIIEALAADPVNGPHRHIDAIFVCRAATELIGQLDHREMTGARWVSLDRMREHNVPPELPAITEAAIAWAAIHGRPATADPETAALLMVTSNPAKAATAAEHMEAYGITVEHIAMDLAEIQAVDVGQVALHKARQAYARLRRPVIVEVGGFFVDDLGGFPGALAKTATSMLGLHGLIRLAELTDTRAAHFESTLAYADAQGERTFTSVGPSGFIADRPAARTREGAWSVLWDIWIPPGKDQPVSALSEEEYGEYLSAWRSRSVFTQLGDWLRSRNESAQ